MIEGIVLGIIQGILEWLPVSSEGFLVLVKTNFFGGGSIREMIRLALFLHLGTFFAALIYFWRDVRDVLVALFKYRTADEESRHLLRFLIIATFVSGALGLALLETLSALEGQLAVTGKIVTGFIGLLLLGTGFLQVKAHVSGTREAKSLTRRDGILLGIMQGFAVLPGFSRSGLTVAILLLKRFKEAQALRLSFLMSLPIVFLGNIVLNIRDFALSAAAMWGLVFSFLFGLLTIHILLKIARRFNFGYFVLGFGLLTILAMLI